MSRDIIAEVMAEQAGLDECREQFMGDVQAIMVRGLMEMMMAEVERLCGTHYHPAPQAHCRRGGSAPGRIRLWGQDLPMERPRVRNKGAGREQVLASYAQARQGTEALLEVLRASAAGVSSRELRRLHPGRKGCGRSQVQREWVTCSLRYVEELRNRDLSQDLLVILMLDGVVLAEGLVAVIALGILGDGRKIVLDFQTGATENLVVCQDLLQRLEKRGLRFGGRPMTVVDGSEALHKALRAQYPDILLQRCLVHKERNLRGYLSRRDYPELSRLMNRLRRAQGATAAREALADLTRFAAGKNQKALASIEEAGDTLIALQLLNVPATLNTSLLSTNAIENNMRNFRAKTRRVTRWQPHSDMAERWTAYALLTLEQGFHRITGHNDLPHLLRALLWPEALIAATRETKIRGESGVRGAPPRPPPEGAGAGNSDGNIN